MCSLECITKVSSFPFKTPLVEAQFPSATPEEILKLASELISKGCSVFEYNSRYSAVVNLFRGIDIETMANRAKNSDPKLSVPKKGSQGEATKSEQLSGLTATITEADRALLDASYKDMEADPEKNGLAVLLRLFQDYPEYKNLWPQFKFITDSSLQNAEELQKFACVYIAGLRTIVANLDDNDQLAETLGKIAHTHLVKGVKRYHLQKMLPCLLATVRGCRGGKPLDKKIEDAWEKLFDIIATMIEIYNKVEKK